MVQSRSSIMAAKPCPRTQATYTVTFDVAARRRLCRGQPGLSAGSFTIAKATPTITAKDLVGYDKPIDCIGCVD